MVCDFELAFICGWYRARFWKMERAGIEWNRGRCRHGAFGVQGLASVFPPGHRSCLSNMAAFPNRPDVLEPSPFGGLSFRSQPGLVDWFRILLCFLTFPPVHPPRALFAFSDLPLRAHDLFVLVIRFLLYREI